MKTSAGDSLTDSELNEMLAAWSIPDPPQSLGPRIFSTAKGESMNLHNFAFERAVTIEQPPSRLASFWDEYARGAGRSGAVSLLLHAGALALLLLIFQTPRLARIAKSAQIVFLPAYQPKLPPAQHLAGGGGGGGQHMRTPVSYGAAPPFAPKQFLPPALAVAKPVLPVTPTITAQAPQIVAEQYGDPLAKMLAASGGPGANGLGSGIGGGLGAGSGDGYGPGSGGGSSGGIYRIGGNVSAPILVSKVDPEYSEEARKAKYSGVVILSVVVDGNGLPRDIKVVRPLGLGLDEKAVEAVAHWRFRPAMRNGKPVAVSANVEVNFRLL